MSKMTDKLCPFKKEVIYDYNSYNRLDMTREVFDFCVGKDCIAYDVISLGEGTEPCEYCKMMK